uniref:Uncharacterized protein n=1 Tax=Neolamprologus brichardi TaxID=32507 RepID=A0A3Q4MCT2_NEOBR
TRNCVKQFSCDHHFDEKLYIPNISCKDKPFKESLGALVKNCNMLHNIVGPACIFLKQGFARTLVCNRKSQKFT